LYLICADCRHRGFHFHRLPFPGFELAAGGAAKNNMKTFFKNAQIAAIMVFTSIVFPFLTSNLLSVMPLNTI
jgi:hypothetical protein